LQGFIKDLFEISALCGFVFGVANHVPPLLTILLLNGCFSFQIIFFLVNKLRIRRKYCRYSQIPQSNRSNRQHNAVTIKYWQIVSEVLGFLLQLTVPLILVVILILVPHNYPISALVLIPISLLIMSCVLPDRPLIYTASSNESQSDDGQIDDNSVIQDKQPTQKFHHAYYYDVDYRPKQGM